MNRNATTRPGVIKKGDVFSVTGNSFGIAETESGYTLYASIACPSEIEGTRAWSNLAAGSDAPEGWKACSDAIPSNTQHNIYDVVPGTMFFLKGCTDDKVYLRW